MNFIFRLKSYLVTETHDKVKKKSIFGLPFIQYVQHKEEIGETQTDKIEGNRAVP